MFKIQEFMSCFDTIEEANVCLKNRLQLDIKTDYLHNYEKNSKIYIYNKGKHSDINNPLVREANGLMIDEEYALVSKGLDHHYKIKGIKDFPENFRLCRSKVEEMTTGVMITVFNYKGVWAIATKDSINDFDYTIDVKRAIGRRLDQSWSSKFDEDKNYIYIFDFISKEYENVWPCPTTPELYLLAIIDIDMGKTLNSYKVDDISTRLGFLRPYQGIIAGKRTLASFISDTRIPSRGVILSSDDIRIKLPNALYYSIKAANEAGEDISTYHVARIFLACKNDVELTVVSQLFPKYSDFLKLFSKITQKIWRDLMIIWNSIQQFDKDPVKFAKAVPPYALSHLLFMYRDRKIKTFKEGVSKMSPHRLVNITKDKYEKELEINNRHLKIECAYENRIISD